MFRLKVNALIFFSIILMASCQSGTSSNTTELDSKDTLQKAELNKSNVTGNYVTADYAERSKGYDWVAVNIELLGTDQIRIKVRSRTDLKKSYLYARCRC
jgi:hypothetical protein